MSHSAQMSNLAACRELEGDYNKFLEVLYVFYHKIWYVLIHTRYARIVVF